MPKIRTETVTLSPLSFGTLLAYRQMPQRSYKHPSISTVPASAYNQATSHVIVEIIPESPSLNSAFWRYILLPGLLHECASSSLLLPLLPFARANP